MGAAQCCHSTKPASPSAAGTAEGVPATPTPKLGGAPAAKSAAANSLRILCGRCEATVRCTKGDFCEDELRRDHEVVGAGSKPLSSGALYKGQWKEEQQHGFGEEMWPDGAVYRGQFQEGQKSGHGELQWPGGAAYRGQFLSGDMHGYGTYLCSDGWKYRGQWRQNCIRGKGHFYWADGQASECVCDSEGANVDYRSFLSTSSPCSRKKTLWPEDAERQEELEEVRTSTTATESQEEEVAKPVQALLQGQPLRSPWSPSRAPAEVAAGLPM